MFFLRKIWELLERIVSFKEVAEFLENWVYPLALPVAAAVAGYLQHEPAMWIITATALSFMATTVTYVAIMALKDRSTPQNKLVWLIVYQQDLDTPPAPAMGNRQQRRAAGTPRLLGLQELATEVNRKIEKAQIGIEITNNSPFPISLILQTAATSIAGEQPPRSMFPKGPYIIGPWSKIRVLDDAIDMDGAPCKRLSGQIDMRIKYGKPGREKFEIHPKGAVDIVMTDFGAITQVMLMVATETINAQTALPSP